LKRWRSLSAAAWKSSCGSEPGPQVGGGAMAGGDRRRLVLGGVLERGREAEGRAGGELEKQVGG
jgi:hypothetical protein